MRRWGRSDPPLVIGHRGASAHERENTLAAFRRARADGADGVELDVLRCSTGEVVVFHDDDLRRLHGRPERVRDLPRAALAELGIPTLSEVFEELGGELLVNVELKASRVFSGQRLAPAVAALVRRHGAERRVLVSSFHPLALARFRTAAPDVPAGLLFHAEQAWPLRSALLRHALRPAALHPDRTLVDAARVAAWHAAGYAVNTWTVDGAEAVRSARRAGVDGIITNDPAATRSFLREL